MEIPELQERPEGSEAFVDQRSVGQGDQGRAEESRPDPFRQLQEAMIRMAEGQEEFFGRRPMKPVPVQRTVVDVNTALFNNFKAMDPPTFARTKG